MKPIRIIIEGAPGSGKTTIAIEIEKHLESLGFDVDVRDGDYQTTTQEFHKMRVESLTRFSKKVTVETRQPQRVPWRPSDEA